MFFAGTTVVISLLGMLLIGISFVGGLGVGAAGLVAVTMLASLTLLPAVLGFVGCHIDKLKLPGTGQARDPRTTAGYRWGHLLQRHPVPFTAVGLVTLIALAVPVLSIRLGSSDESRPLRLAATNPTKRPLGARPGHLAQQRPVATTPARPPLRQDPNGRAPHLPGVDRTGGVAYCPVARLDEVFAASAERRP